MNENKEIPDRCPLCDTGSITVPRKGSICAWCCLSVQHWSAIRALKTELSRSKARIAELRKQLDETTAELNYEHKRRRDDEGVWLETRSANQRLTDEIARLKSELAAKQIEIDNLKDCF